MDLSPSQMAPLPKWLRERPSPWRGCVRTGRVDGLSLPDRPDACLALAVHGFRETKASKHPFYGAWCKIGENKRNRTLVNSLVPPLSHVILHVLRSTLSVWSSLRVLLLK